MELRNTQQIQQYVLPEMKLPDMVKSRTKEERGVSLWTTNFSKQLNINFIGVGILSPVGTHTKLYESSREINEQKENLSLHLIYF